MANKDKAGKKAGEDGSKVAQPPVNAKKILDLITRMFPDSREKAKTLQDGVTWLLAENDRMRRRVEELEKVVPGPNIQGGGDVGLHKKMDDLMAQFKQLKEQFSVMRQYGVGVK